MAQTGITYRDNTGTNNLGNSGTGGAQTNATALPVNSARVGFMIQNQGTNVLYVLLGSGASSSVYNIILKGCTGAADGTGGSFAMMTGDVYRGIVTIAGTNPSYSVTEL